MEHETWLGAIPRSGVGLDAGVPLTFALFTTALRALTTSRLASFAGGFRRSASTLRASTLLCICPSTSRPPHVRTP
eukprot:1070861-Prorocentrum_minimum.AAC.1